MGNVGKIVGILCIVGAVVFFVLAILIPVVVICSPDQEFCIGAREIKRGEQLACDVLLEDWVAGYDNSAIDDGVLKAYKIVKSTTPTVTREVNWDKTGMTLRMSYNSIRFYVPRTATIYPNFTCSGDGCSYVKIYFLTQNELNDCRDSRGTFYEGDASLYLIKDGIYGTYSPTNAINTNNVYPWTYYFLVSLSKSGYSATVDINLNMNYRVYDVSSKTPVTCKKGECDVGYVSAGETVVLDYPLGSNGPKEVEASIYDWDINWSSAIANLIVWLICAIVCLCLAVFFLKKVAKKAAKKVAKETGTVVAPAPAPVAAAPAPAAYPAGQPAAYPAGQPYPGQPADPSYAAQPYPGQPYPGQPAPM